MNRATRDKFVSRTDEANPTSGNACWETAPLIYEKLNEDFGPFDIDLTADASNHLLPVWFGPCSPYGSGGFDVLTAKALDDPQCIGDWSAFQVHNGYSNPVYGRFVSQLLPLAKANAQHCGFTSTLLLPLRITRVFHAHVLDGASEVWLPSKRLVFFEKGLPRLNERLWREEGKVRADGALFDSVIVRYVPGHQGPPRFSSWAVPPHVTKLDLAAAAARRREQEARGAGRSIWEERESA
jgi:hypothetical protein